jgi:tetratricopeptide (TPR) repeat protein
MTLPPINPAGWIPDPVKRQIADGLFDFLQNLAGKVLNDQAAAKVARLKSDGDFQQALDQGLARATTRFVNEYAEQDEDLVEAISTDSKFWQAKSVRQAVLTLLQHPGHYEDEAWDVVAQKFDDVLPGRRNRERVDRAVKFYLRCVAEEVWHLPPLKPIYELQMQRISIDKAEAMLREVQGMRADLQQTMLALARGLDEQRQLTSGSLAVLSAPPQVFHNLPQPDYVRFVGRETELAQLHALLSPDNRTWVIVIDGIGGIGKSSMALEVAHDYLNRFDELPERQRFKAVIWTSAKALTLTADGPAPRQQITRTLSDIYTAIAVTLQREDITRARPEEQDVLVRQALTRQRTLLIIDNMETIDDEQVEAFLRELPTPTKCIVTTRHRVDVAYPIRLQALPRKDALNLIAQECEKKGVVFKADETDRLYRHTGGVPLALVWSIAQMGFGTSIETVLHRIGDAEGDIARYCFRGALELIRGWPAHRLLMALAIFAHDASRVMLGHIADLSLADRDEGLAQLERLSLVNKRADRFWFLPLTRTFAFSELTRDHAIESQLRRRWIDYLKDITRGADSEYYWRYRSDAYYDEGENILDAVEWCFAHGSAEDVFALTAAAHDYLEVVGRWNEMLDLCRRSLGLAVSVQNPIAGAWLANIIGWVLSQMGEYAEAEKMCQDALTWYQSVSNREGESVVLQHLSIIHRKRGDFDTARQLNDRAWRIADERAIGDLKVWILVEYGKLARDQHEWEAAWTYFSIVKDWFEKRVEQTPRDEPLARGVWGQLALVAYHLGRPQEAKDLCLKSLEFYERYGTKGYMATLKYRLALAEEALGEDEAALRHAKEAVDWSERLGMKPDHAEALMLLDRLTTSV